jgi:hypothetical protein
MLTPVKSVVRFFSVNHSQNFKCDFWPVAYFDNDPVADTVLTVA